MGETRIYTLDSEKHPVTVGIGKRLSLYCDSLWGQIEIEIKWQMVFMSIYLTILPPEQAIMSRIDTGCKAGYQPSRNDHPDA